MNIDKQSLFEMTMESKETLQKIIREDGRYARHIITIGGEGILIEKTSKAEIHDVITRYKVGTDIKGKKYTQSGKLWILVGKKGDEVESLNVGQSMDIYEEIEWIIARIMRQEGDYFALTKQYEELFFYEIEQDVFLEEFSGQTRAQLQELAYELAKDYLAEYMVAKNTSAKHWNYYGSGMDKRFYFHFEEKALSRLSETEKQEIVNIAAQAYGFNPQDAIQIPGHEGGRNLVYRVGDKGVLRVSSLADRIIEDYKAELEYLHFLAKGGATVADSIPTQKGERVKYINGTVVSMFAYAKGDQMADHGYRYREGAPIEEYFYNTGKTLGKIHALSKQYKPRYRRFDFFEKYNEEYFETLIPDDFLCMKIITGRQIKDRLHEVLEQLRKLGKTPENYGMVHFDYSDGNYNVEFDTGRINVFDFDNCRSCWYLFDIANLWSHGLGWTSRNADPTERRKYMDGYMRTVVEGYRSECEISDEELGNLELMVDTVLMENIVDDFEVFKVCGKEFDFDEEKSYNVKCFVDKLPWIGFYDNILEYREVFDE